MQSKPDICCSRDVAGTLGLSCTWQPDMQGIAVGPCHCEVPDTRASVLHLGVRHAGQKASVAVQLQMHWALYRSWQDLQGMAKVPCPCEIADALSSALPLAMRHTGVKGQPQCLRGHA